MNHWLPSLDRQGESSQDLGNSLCIVLSALSRIKQQHPSTTRVPDGLLEKISELLENPSTYNVLTTKDICSLLLYLSRLECYSASIFGSVVEKLDFSILSCELNQ